MTRRRPKWIRARVRDDGTEMYLVARDFFNPLLCQAGYKPGDRVVIMSAADARELRRDAKKWRGLNPAWAEGFHVVERFKPKARKGSGS